VEQSEVEGWVFAENDLPQPHELDRHQIPPLSSRNRCDRGFGRARTGPIFHYSDTWKAGLYQYWQTTIITFLMVVPHSTHPKTKSSMALQLKINEIRVAALHGAARLHLSRDLSRRASAARIAWRVTSRWQSGQEKSKSTSVEKGKGTTLAEKATS